MLVNGRDWVQTRMYRSLREIWEGFSKNAFYFDVARATGGRALGLAALLLNSTFLILSGRGVTWKGRRYSGAANEG